MFSTEISKGNKGFRKDTKEKKEDVTMLEKNRLIHISPTLQESVPQKPSESFPQAANSQTKTFSAVKVSHRKKNRRSRPDIFH